ncbi:hypothetical protein D2908_02225 [Streptococcus sp. LQJ-218]|nr:hypothetical protein D2908_02225 [Streptococcus sp. LQJ-218]
MCLFNHGHLYRLPFHFRFRKERTRLKQFFQQRSQDWLLSLSSLTKHVIMKTAQATFNREAHTTFNRE